MGKTPKWVKLHLLQRSFEYFHQQRFWPNILKGKSSNVGPKDQKQPIKNIKKDKGIVIAIQAFKKTLHEAAC